MQGSRRRLTVLALSLAACVTGAGRAPGEDAARPSFVLELNRAEAQAGSCRLTFVAENRLGADLAKAGYEIVLFDAKGLVERLTVFDFGAMPAGKTLVRRFDLAGADCAGLSRILVNGAASCEGPGIDAGACAAGLETRNKTAIAFGH